MTQADTKDKILDSAEMLFAEHGFNATSTRQITQQAEVNIASVNYHFRSKEKLMEAVLTRRLEPLNEERLHRLKRILDLAEKEGHAPGHGDVLRAFVEPTMLKLYKNKAYWYFHDILIRMQAAPEKSLKAHFLSLMSNTLMRFIDALALCFPERTRQQNMGSFMLAIGAMNHAIVMVREVQHAETPLQELLQFEPLDYEEIVRSLLMFITKGMEEYA